MSKKLYIEFLEERVGDLGVAIEVLQVVAKNKRESFQEKILKANDDFFNLGDSCREQINKLAHDQLASLKSAQIFNEKIEDLECSFDHEIEELEKTISNLEVLNHELIAENKKLLYKAAKKNEQR
ncbi:MAG: hypothetical protein JJE18_01560 [Eubacteriaceae bacterium]|nr:hypothetical protein [Eubacteriaceae bacterium]